MYCNGSALERLRQSCRRHFRLASGQSPGFAVVSTCSLSHLSSLIAESSVLVPRRMSGSSGEIL